MHSEDVLRAIAGEVVGVSPEDVHDEEKLKWSDIRRAVAIAAMNSLMEKVSLLVKIKELEDALADMDRQVLDAQVFMAAVIAKFGEDRLDGTKKVITLTYSDLAAAPRDVYMHRELDPMHFKFGVDVNEPR